MAESNRILWVKIEHHRSASIPDEYHHCKTRQGQDELLVEMQGYYVGTERTRVFKSESYDYKGFTIEVEPLGEFDDDYNGFKFIAWVKQAETIVNKRLGFTQAEAEQNAECMIDYNPMVRG